MQDFHCRSFCGHLAIWVYVFFVCVFGCFWCVWVFGVFWCSFQFSMLCSFQFFVVFVFFGCLVEPGLGMGWVFLPWATWDVLRCLVLSTILMFIRWLVDLVAF